MSKNEIKVNDLVMIVKPCPFCNFSKYKLLGTPFLVTGLDSLSVICETTGKIGGTENVALGYLHYKIPLSWLKKINPDEFKEFEKTENHLTCQTT